MYIISEIDSHIMGKPKFFIVLNSHNVNGTGGFAILYRRLLVPSFTLELFSNLEFT